MKNGNLKILIAPCGTNCGFCFAFLRVKNKCTGCRGCDQNKPISRTACKIKNCQFFQNENATFCFECESYPCKRLTHIDTRYRTKYNVSLIENLEKIKKGGIHEFISRERIKWKCPSCGQAVCLHTGRCVVCGMG